ncbi:DUF5131 family protein [Streptomyces sp. NPDC058299]|uniref:DUF5131 family protein n=1 Tax=Streptomyces sp. NPDC058299 TaxID=3346435 RepID=UPI0036EB9F77
MSTTTKIEWTRGPDGSPGKTWSPLIGCDRVSPGCDRCYAITTANIRSAHPNPKVAVPFTGTVQRTAAGLDWTGRVNLLEDRLTEPLRWRKPYRVFVNSLSDLFHREVPSDFIAQVFAVMALTPRHTYQVLTKRHARMQNLLNSEAFHTQVLAWAARLQDDTHPMPSWDVGTRQLTAWPLPNVWLGVSVEDQKRANLRVPALLDTPAAVRFVSAEPLLGPVDLTTWMPPVGPMPTEEAPATWAEWTWPDWVPAQVREQIEDSWSSRWGLGPRHWIRDMHDQGAPAFGARLTMDDGFSSTPPQVTGRFVYCWGNIGRLALDDDPTGRGRAFAYTSFGWNAYRQTRGIDWVIVGGESGPGARPMHADWARSLRDQAVAARAAFLFKQWGEWGPAPFQVRVCDPEVGWKGTAEELVTAKADSEARGATHVHTGNWWEQDGKRRYEVHEMSHKPWSLERCGLPEGMEAIRRWGKKRAGRELDGRTWDEYPDTATKATSRKAA